VHLLPPKCLCKGGNKGCPSRSQIFWPWSDSPGDCAARPRVGSRGRALPAAPLTPCCLTAPALRRGERVMARARSVPAEGQFFQVASGRELLDPAKLAPALHLRCFHRPSSNPQDLPRQRRVINGRGACNLHGFQPIVCGRQGAKGQRVSGSVTSHRARGGGHGL